MVCLLYCVLVSPCVLVSLCPLVCACVPLPVGAVAPGVAKSGGQVSQGDLCRVAVPPTVVASGPTAPREHSSQYGIQLLTFLPIFLL